jgi:transcription elongation factor GreA
MEYLSKQRYDEIASELDHLINVVYPQVRENLAETSAQGDRSENAGYREARRNQAKTISRIRFLQKVLEHSRVIDPEALPSRGSGPIWNIATKNITSPHMHCVASWGYISLHISLRQKFGSNTVPE